MHCESPNPVMFRSPPLSARLTPSAFVVMEERNSLGAVKAVTAAQLAMASNSVYRVSLDQAIEAMRLTAADMSVKYKETSLSVRSPRFSRVVLPSPFAYQCSFRSLLGFGGKSHCPFDGLFHRSCVSFAFETDNGQDTTYCTHMVRSLSSTATSSRFSLFLSDGTDDNLFQLIG